MGISAAAGDRQVERAAGGGDVERDLVGGGQQRHAVGADLVGRVAVGGDAVGPGHDGLHPALAHHLGGHVVADQRHVDPALLQLPGGQPGALQQRAGLVGVDVQRLARLGGGEEHGQRRAVVGGGQPAGVAVGQHALPVAEQFGPVAADRPAHLPIFFVDRLGLGQQRGGDFGASAGREAARPLVSSARGPRTD